MRVRLLAIGSYLSMPPTKVCPQCKAAVPARWKTCECCDLVFRSKRKAEGNLREKRMRAVESDSVKSARKAKGKLHKHCERESETRERTLHGQEQTRMGMASMKESRDSGRFLYSQHTSTITCTAAPRVWHFSAFHCYGNEQLS